MAKSKKETTLSEDPVARGQAFLEHDQWSSLPSQQHMMQRAVRQQETDPVKPRGDNGQGALGSALSRTLRH